MKGFFKHLILAITAVFTLASCDVLMPAVRRPSSENISSKKESVSVPSGVQILCGEEPLNAVQGEKVFATHYMYDETSGTNLHLVDGSSATSLSSDLTVAFDCYFNYLSVSLYCETVGAHDYEVHLVSSEGYELFKTYTVYVEPMSDECFVEINAPKSFIVYKEYEIEWRIRNPATGSYLRINESQPYRVVRKSSSFTIKRSHLSDPSTLTLVIYCSEEVSDYCVLDIQSTRGEWYQGEFEYYVKSSTPPSYGFVTDPQKMIVEDGGYIEVCVYMIDINNNNEKAPFDTSNMGFNRENSNFNIEVLEFDTYFLKLRITNVIPKTMMYFDLFLLDIDGYNCNCRLEVYTSYYWYNVPRLLIGFNYDQYNKPYMVIYVTPMADDYKTITKIRIISLADRFSEVVLDNLDVTVYYYYFDNHPSGRDQIKIEVTIADGTTLTREENIEL